MTVVILALAIPLVLLGVHLVRSALAGVPAIAQVLRVRRRRIASVDPTGEEGAIVEIAGTVEAASEPCASLSGVPAVAARLTVKSHDGVGDDGRLLGEREELVVARAIVRDGSGACALDLAHVEVVGERRSAAAVPLEDFLASAPPWAAALRHESATHVEVVEEIVPVGARVLVSGRVGPAVVDPAEATGYRGARGAVRVTLAGAESARLLLSVGGQAGFVARATLPVLAGALVGAYLVAFGLVCAVGVLLD